jgi:hypothetical protein
MAVSRQNSANDNSLVVYENCNPSDKFGVGIDKEKLSSIVGYASKVMGINQLADAKAEECFTRYCKALEEKLGPGEPYIASIEMKESKKDSIIKQMKDLLPYKVKKFDELIEFAAEKAVASLKGGSGSQKSVLLRFKEESIEMSAFVVLKVFRSGENLELTPCYMSVKGGKTEARVLLFQVAESESSMTYKQQKFILSKYEIQAIINGLKEESKRKEKWRLT